MSDFDLTYKQTGDLGNKIGGQAGAKGILSGELIVVPRNDPRAAGRVLQLERNASVASRRFVMSESFTTSNTRVKFGYIDETILKLFRKEEDVPAGELAIHTLLQDNHYPEIMVALGPQSRRYIKLGHFYQLIEAQGQGQEGPLLINDFSNIAYVLDQNGAPWAVRARWRRLCEDWLVNVRSVAYLSTWRSGGQVLSQVA